MTFLYFNEGFSQFYRYSNPAAEVNIEFLKEKIEARSASTFFNTVTVTNNSSKEVNFNLRITVPEGWSLMANEQYSLKLEAGQQIVIPFRASVSKKAKGEIGYIIGASILDQKGVVLKNKYSFVHIPKEFNLTIKPLNRITYINNDNTDSEIKLLVSNKGNSVELVGFKITSNNNIKIDNEIKNVLEFDIQVPPQKDTIINLSATYIPDDLGILLYKVDIKSFNENLDYSTTIWYKFLSNEFSNTLSTKYIPLSIDIGIQNLFQETSPNYMFTINGNTLFKNDHILYYRLQTLNNWQNDLYSGTRFWVGYKVKDLNIKLGDVTNGIGKSLNGKGFEFQLNKKKASIKVLSVYNLNRDRLDHGIEYAYRLSGTNRIRLQVALENNRKNNSNAALTSINSSFKFKSHLIGFQLGVSSLDLNNLDFSSPKLGWYNNVSYSTKFKKTTIIARSNYGSSDYLGFFNGRWIINSEINHSLTNTQFLNFSYYKTSISPKSTNENFKKIDFIDNYSTKYTYHYSRNISGIATILFDNLKSNNFTGISNNSYVHVLSPKAKIDMRIRGNDPYNIFAIGITSSFNFVDEFNYVYDSTTVNINKNSNISYIISSLVRTKNFGVFLNYFDGPRTSVQFLNNSLYKADSKVIMLTPFYENFLYKNIVKTRFDLNYYGDIISRANRINLNIQTEFYLKNSLQIEFLANISYMTDYDQIEEETQKYSSTYFGLRIKKEFGWDQPRVKFHDITLQFYKDLNGNKIKDDKEPGVKDVLVFFKRLKDNEFIHSDNIEFMNIELLSNQSGIILYEKLPEGLYEITLVPVGKTMGNYSAEESKITVKVDNDQNIFIPFLENNKIFGKIALNRSKISNLGRLDLSNIKISATSTTGKIYSALTDKSGNFTIFVPNVDKYTVKVNNIFYEHFNLQQNNFEVQLNGYRQFEVTFIFDEKVRRINFDRQLDDLDFNGVKIIRRTNLQGTVKDASTLLPVRAKVQILNSSNNSTITVTSSNRNNAKYNTTFVAGENYKIIVSADDYWYHAENLYINQITTFQNLTKNILLKQITIGSKIELIGVNFNQGSSEILPEFLPELERLIEILKDNPTIRVEVQGYCDDIESIDYPNISLERANAITKYLIEKGFSNIEAKGYGNTRPVAGNDNAESRRRNRRIEVEIISK